MPVEEQQKKNNKRERQNQADNLTTGRTSVDLHRLIVDTQDALLIGNRALE